MDKDYILECVKRFAMEMEQRGVKKKYPWSDVFDLKAYNKAATQIILQAISESDAPPSIVVENLIKKFDDYACMAKVPDTKRMFSIACDMATCIGDYILSLANERR